MFAFDGDPTNEHLPHNYTDNHVAAYIGTHDNETIVGSFRDKTEYELAYLYEYLNIDRKAQIPNALIRLLLPEYCRCCDSTDAGHTRTWKRSPYELSVHGW